jgi:hypothetical protein
MGLFGLSAGKGQKRWGFQGFGASLMPRAAAHLGNAGIKKRTGATRRAEAVLLSSYFFVSFVVNLL